MTPNTSLKRSPNGRPPAPGRWNAVHFHRPGAWWPAVVARLARKLAVFRNRHARRLVVAVHSGFSGPHRDAWSRHGACHVSLHRPGGGCRCGHRRGSECRPHRPHHPCHARPGCHPAHVGMAVPCAQLVGAAYLIYLGVGLLRTKATALVVEASSKRSLLRLFLDGAISNISNLKIAIFYFAFLSQFVRPAAPHPTLSVFCSDWCLPRSRSWSKARLATSRGCCRAGCARGQVFWPGCIAPAVRFCLHWVSNWPSSVVLKDGQLLAQADPQRHASATRRTDNPGSRPHAAARRSARTLGRRSHRLTYMLVVYTIAYAIHLE